MTSSQFDSPVPPGSGWPEDPATAQTPVAGSAADVARAAAGAGSLASLMAQVSVCRACPRLVEWRERVAKEKRRAYADQPYWGRPVPSWGSDEPRVLIMGLAPAAHGANRTGRMFTGDQSGVWLFGSLYRVGLATQPASEHAGDSLRLIRTRMVVPVHCAPPANKPTTVERETCAPWLDAEMRLLLRTVRAVVALGGYGWDATLRTFRRIGGAAPRPKPKFGHGAETEVYAPDGQAVRLLGTYHPSQQNTFTKRLTEPMLDAVLARAKEVAGA